MSRVRNYKDFVYEEIFGLFKKETETPMKSKVNKCIETILRFLKENQIVDWNDFISMKQFDRKIVDDLIDSSIDTPKELNEVKFGLRLNLSDKPQLKEMLKEYEEKEEYEKCSKILKKIKSV